jgi:hypothetical protein
MQKQIFTVDLVVAPQMLDPRTQQVARPPHNPVNGVTFLQKQFGQIRAVLPGDSGDERNLLVAHSGELTGKPKLEKSTARQLASGS